MRRRSSTPSLSQKYSSHMSLIICILVESTRIGPLSSTQQLASQLANQHAKLAAQLNTLNSWFSGQAPATITGYLEPSPSNHKPKQTNLQKARGTKDATLITVYSSSQLKSGGNFVFQFYLCMYRRS